MKLKHFLIVVAITVLFLLLIIPDVDAQIAVTPTADKQRAAFVASQRDAQLIYRAANGGAYFQTLRISRDDAADVTPCPLDRPPCPRLVLPRAPREISFVVNVYESPAGWGYEIVSEYVENGRRYVAVDNRGPEMWRAHEWRPATEVRE